MFVVFNDSIALKTMFNEVKRHQLVTGVQKKVLKQENDDFVELPQLHQCLSNNTEGTEAGFFSGQIPKGGGTYSKIFVLTFLVNSRLNEDTEEEFHFSYHCPEVQI